MFSALTELHAATSEQPFSKVQLRLILLPKSIAQVDAWGACAVVENKAEPAALYVPLASAEAWREFIAVADPHYRVTKCSNAR
jgi:hypothetical protein